MFTSDDDEEEEEEEGRLRRRTSGMAQWLIFRLTRGSSPLSKHPPCSLKPPTSTTIILQLQLQILDTLALLTIWTDKVYAPEGSLLTKNSCTKKWKFILVQR
jgi:hypothetical protein